MHPSGRRVHPGQRSRAGQSSPILSQRGPMLPSTPVLQSSCSWQNSWLDPEFLFSLNLVCYNWTRAGSWEQQHAFYADPDLADPGCRIKKCKFISYMHFKNDKKNLVRQAYFIGYQTKCYKTNIYILLAGSGSGFRKWKQCCSGSETGYSRALMLYNYMFS